MNLKLHFLSKTLSVLTSMAGSSAVVAQTNLIWTNQLASDAKPAASNSPGQQYPKIDSERHAEFRTSAPDAQIPVMFFSMGAAENLTATRNLDKLLSGARINHVYYESPGTAHEWQTWRRSFHEFAPLLFRN